MQGCAVEEWTEKVGVQCYETCHLSPSGLVGAAVKGMDKHSGCNMVCREMAAWRLSGEAETCPMVGFQWLHVVLLEPSLSLAAGVGIFYVML